MSNLNLERTTVRALNETGRYTPNRNKFYKHDEMYINDILELDNGMFQILYANGHVSKELPGETVIKVQEGKF